MSEHLLIGGIADGQVVGMNTATRYLDIPVPCADGIGRQQYQREELRAGDRVYYVYVCDDTPNTDVIGRLIAGYHLGRNEGRREI